MKRSQNKAKPFLFNISISINTFPKIIEKNTNEKWCRRELENFGWSDVFEFNFIMKRVLSLYFAELYSIKTSNNN